MRIGRHASRYVKMLGLGALAAMAAMAFVGVASASATTKVCENGTEPCGALYSGNVSGSLAEGNATFTSTAGASGTVTCTESSYTGNTNSSGEGELTAASYHSGGGGDCTSTFFSNPTVTVTVENLNYTATTTYESHTYEGVAYDGKLALTKPGSSVQFKLTVHAFAPFTCVYQPEGTLTAHLKNSTHQVVYGNAPFTETGGGTGGALCASTGVFNAKYTLKGSSNQNLWVLGS